MDSTLINTHTIATVTSPHKIICVCHIHDNVTCLKTNINTMLFAKVTKTLHKIVVTLLPNEIFLIT